MCNKVYWCGFNGFGNFEKCEKRSSSSPTESQINYLNSDVVVSLSWSFTCLAKYDELIILGFIEFPNQTKTIKMETKIEKLCSNDNFILILLENGKLIEFDMKKNCLNEIKIPKLVGGKKRNIWGEERNSLDESEPEITKHIALSNNNSGKSNRIVISNNNNVYNNGEKIHEFHKHIKIKALASGFEHFLILNGNGDLYSFGNGLRGQLGHPEMESLSTPTLIEALAGIKVIEIGASGWHSAAISSYGDLYVWGNNCTGQLGLNVYSTVLQSGSLTKRKNPTVYALPQLIDLLKCCDKEDCGVTKVSCGVRHTFIQTQCRRIFSCGWNLYGQLCSDKYSDDDKNFKVYKDSFTEIKNKEIQIKSIVCGQWNTIFISH